PANYSSRGSPRRATPPLLRRIRGQAFRERHGSREEFPRRCCRSLRDARAQAPSRDGALAMACERQRARDFLRRRQARGPLTKESATRRDDCCGEHGIFVGEYGPQIEDHAIVFNTRNHGRAARWFAKTVFERRGGTERRRKRN